MSGASWKIWGITYLVTQTNYKEADGWEAGCWYTIGYTARGAWW